MPIEKTEDGKIKLIPKKRDTSKKINRVSQKNEATVHVEEPKVDNTEPEVASTTTAETVEKPAKKSSTRKKSTKTKSTTSKKSTKSKKQADLNVEPVAEAPVEPVENVVNDSNATNTIEPVMPFNEDDVLVTMHSYGDKNCFLYFSIKLTDYTLDADIISLALVDSTGRSFYAEFTDYEMSKCSVDTFTNVIKKLKNPTNVLDGDSWTVKGSSTDIGKIFSLWIKKFTEEKLPIQLVGDKSYLEFLLFMKFLNLGASIQAPPAIIPAMVDINQEIAATFMITKKQEDNYFDFIKGYIPNQVAALYDRQLYIDEQGIDIDYEREPGNPLYEARLIRTIHQDMYPFDEIPQIIN